MGLHMPSWGELLCRGVGIALVVLLIVLVVRTTTRPSPPPLAHGFPLEPADGPGRYEVVGVNRESKLDTTWQCDAQSLANARVKAELEGIIVTSVRKVG